MREVEVKARADLERVRRRLEELGAQLVGVEDQDDTYFEHPCRSMIEGDEALRLRVAGGRVELTYKGPRERATAKSRLELSVQLSDAETAKRLLEQLGFRESVRVRKRREVYRLGGVLVALDSVEGLGCFVEVEGEDEGEVLAALGSLGAREIVGETYAELAARRLERPPSPPAPHDLHRSV